MSHWVITAGLVAGDNHLHVRFTPKATKLQEGANRRFVLIATC
jgi:hypothetical protein